MKCKKKPPLLAVPFVGGISAIVLERLLVTFSGVVGHLDQRYADQDKENNK